jgi:HEAT repeat protein
MDNESARKALAGQDVDGLAAALEFLGNQGKLTDLQPMLAFVKHIDQRVTKSAILACSNLIRNNLINHFHELAPAVRQKLGTVMETLVPQIIDEIGKDLYCADDTRRLRAVQILGLLKKNPKILDILGKLVQDRDEKIRATAVNLLGKVVGPNDHDLIMSLLNDKDKRVRANTVEALERLGNKRLVPILLRFRKDPINRIRGNVLKALYTLGYKEIEEDLLDMLKNPDNFMKASALWVVAQLKLQLPKLEDLSGFYLLSDNEMVFINSKKALIALDSPRAKGFLSYLDSETIEKRK